MVKYAYFLGCITPNRYPGIELSTIKVLNKLGAEVSYIEGTSCCPPPGVFGSFDLLTWIVIAARNLSIAEELSTDVLVTCNGCYATFQDALKLLNENSMLKIKVNEFLKSINREYKGTAKVKSVVDILTKDIGFENLRNKITNPLYGIKVAVHYGCHFLKPSSIREHGSPERPTLIDDLVRATGAETVDYKNKNMCCGAGGGVRSGNFDLAIYYTKRKVDSMIKAKADCVVTPCAFCHLQFDTGQVYLSQSGNKYELPVVYITQLLGLAFGMSMEDVGLHKNMTPIKNLKAKLIQR